MQQVFREISKLICFTVALLFPMGLWYLSGQNNAYLWFYGLSIVVIGMMFAHYENLEVADSAMEYIKNEHDEATQEAGE